jgi:hypothetical protein
LDRNDPTVLAATDGLTFAAGFPWGKVAPPGISAIAAAIALTALIVGRAFQNRAQVAGLLARFDAKEFHVRMWRMEQMTRRGRDATHTEPMQIRELKALIDKDSQKQAKLAIFNDALATDWGSNRVDMQSVYFFALEMRNTLSGPGWLARRGARRLNLAFGYQLLSTFLDQQLVAWRLLPNEDHAGMDEDQRRTYYADNYGLTDPRYVQLVEWLADDLFNKHGSHLPAEAFRRLRGKRESIAEATRTAASKSAPHH